MKRRLAVILASAAMVGCGATHDMSQAPSAGQHALTLARMTATQRLVAMRPDDLPAGTKIYRPSVVEIDAPGNAYLVQARDVLSSTADDISIRFDGKMLHFSPRTAKITFDARSQEVYVPPGSSAPAGAGLPVATIH